ncbi:MAG: ATP-binding protein [Lachnospira sp.]
MLKKFTLKNYKNFKDEITIDFENIAGYQFNTDCLSEGIIGKILIYGRNATGKTNLGKALLDIGLTMFGGTRYAGNGILLNADSIEDAAVFQYEFRFGDVDLGYKYSRLSNQELRDEELFIDGKSIFKCNFSSQKYNFDHLNYIDAETANIDRYLQSLEVGEDDEISEPKLPFLRWLISNVALKNDSALIQLANYVRRMMMITVGNGMRYRFGRMNEGFYESLENPERLKDFEDFLNAMGIECKLILKKLPDGQRELYFAHEQLVPFYENASSGTLALAELYRRLIPKVWDASLIYLDEFDAFYHYEMAENVIRFFKHKYPKCQMIMTSHNTNLMTNRIMRPDCLFILSRKGTLTALCNATERELREGHNLEKMYISGEFEKYE